MASLLRMRPSSPWEMPGCLSTNLSMDKASAECRSFPGRESRIISIDPRCTAPIMRRISCAVGLPLVFVVCFNWFAFNAEPISKLWSRCSESFSECRAILPVKRFLKECDHQDCFTCWFHSFNETGSQLYCQNFSQIKLRGRVVCRMRIRIINNN